VKSVYDFYITPEEYEAARRNGISPKTLETRIRRYGWSKARAMTQPVNRRHYKHPDFDRYKEMARRNGIPLSVFGVRLGKGWESLRAASFPHRPRKLGNANIREYGQARRKYPKELLQRAAANGIGYGTFKNRVCTLGWAPEEAASRPVMSRSEIGRLGRQRYEAIHGNVDKLIFRKRG